MTAQTPLEWTDERILALMDELGASEKDGAKIAVFVIRKIRDDLTAKLQEVMAERDALKAELIKVLDVTLARGEELHPQPTNYAAIIADFYRRVCERAEKNMELTGTVSGAHWNAMRQVCTEMGIEVPQ